MTGDADNRDDAGLKGAAAKAAPAKPRQSQSASAKPARD